MAKRFFLIFSGALLFLPLVLIAAQTGQKIKRLKGEELQLESEIEDLELYISSLDENRSKLLDELVRFEGSLKSRLQTVVIPLLGWPDRIFTTESSSWVEFQRSQLLLRNLRQKLVKEPLKLMADRELRLSELEKLRHELQENVASLKTKQELLNLQLEELKLLDSREKLRLPSASARKKKRIGDIEDPKE